VHLEAGAERRNSLIQSVGFHLLQREITPHLGGDYFFVGWEHATMLVIRMAITVTILPKNFLPAFAATFIRRLQNRTSAQALEALD
jgi:hypothetical protein